MLAQSLSPEEQQIMQNKVIDVLTPHWEHSGPWIRDMVNEALQQADYEQLGLARFYREMFKLEKRQLIEGYWVADNSTASTGKVRHYKLPQSQSDLDLSF